MQKVYLAQRQILATLPQTPGIYIYFNKLNRPIYVGKAINLKSRVSSYFASRKSMGTKTKRMISEAQRVKIVTVGSEFEALLLEADLIRKFKPKYNTASKDDKTPCYIAITNEEYPRILITRKSNLDKGFVVKNVGLAQVYGPFQSAYRTRQLLKVIRRLFPFCQQRVGRKACLYSQMGLCDPCPSFIESFKTHDKKAYKALREKYLSNIRKVKSVLSGKIIKLNKQLEAEMNSLAKQQHYEQARKVKQQLDGLSWLRRPVFGADDYIGNPNLLEDVRLAEMDALVKLLSSFFNLRSVRRIECFDVAHLSGTEPVASMATLIKGEPDKRYYRHFKVGKAKKSDDITAMQEVVERRAKHFGDWGKPNLVVVDGGKGQLGVTVEFFEKEHIPVIGLEKKTESLVIKKNEGFVRIRVPQGPALHILQRARDEAHRFARSLHHKRLSKALLATYNNSLK